ncbi:hypothetical protein [Endozoicomonas sp. ALB115]|uniref:DUF1281 family ferredoxin-like fold protein n=1 Tax=Endozoicomonas sp. ALB115 TaxID=3403074 RepID=UPI003BB49A5D
MPNHVTNMMQSSKEVISSMMNDAGLPDFSLVIPMHGDLDLQGRGYSMSAEDAAKLVCGNHTHENPLIAMLSARERESIDVTSFRDTEFNQFLQMVINKRKHGYYHSMDFARNAWGTKWGAYDFDKSRSTEETLVFDTAWNSPEKIFKALSKKFPDEKIVINYADEDLGSNCGKYTLLNGEIIESDIAPSYSEQSTEEKRKWNEFAFLLCHGETDPKEWGYDEQWNLTE